MSTGRDFHSQDVAIVVLSAIIYLLDVATDVVVIIQYMFEERLIWFSLSLAFVVVPMVCIQVFSLKWLLTKRSTKISCISGFLHFIGLALIKRYADVLTTWSELKSTSDPLRTEKLFQQVHSAFLLRMFQTFLEAAPQLILQSYVLLCTWDGSGGTGFSLIISLISFAWGFVTYSDNLRLQSRNIPRQKWPSFLLQIGWQIGMTLSRVAAIIMFTFCFKSWIFLAIGIHWLLMSVWIIAEKPKLSSVWWQDKLLSCVVGFIYIFCFLHIQKGSGRWHLFFFYALLLLENSLAVIAWLLSPINIPETYLWLFTALVFTGFLIGLVCLLIFYCCFHPDQNNSVEDCRTSVEDKIVARIERAKPSSSSLISNRSLMNKHIIDSSSSSRHTSSVYPCREDPIGCYSKMSDNIHFFSRNDDSPNISGSISPIDQGTLFDDTTYPERITESSANKIYTSSVIEEEATPYGSKSVKRKLKQGSLTLDRYKRKDDVENGSLKCQPKRNKSGDFKGSISKAKLVSAASNDMQIHPNYYRQIPQMQNVALSPVYHLTKERRPLARHHSENVKSSSVSTLDNLSDQYHNWQESREGSDNYLEMLEKYRDRGNKPAKYTYLDSVYQPTTKPMECKTKEGPLTRLRSSFRRHLNAIKTPTYKEMSPVLNPGRYCTSQESLDTKSGSFQQSHPWPNYEIRHYPRDHAGRFYDVHNPRVHSSNSEELTYQSYVQRHPCHQIYNEPARCLNCRQCCNPVPNCNNYCSHKRMSYAENCSHSNLMENATSYQIRKATSLENINTLNDNQSLRNFSTASPHGYKPDDNPAKYRTLPSHYMSQYPCSSAFSPCHDGSVYDKTNVHPEYKYKQEPSDAHTYVVYSDKPSANRCTSAPPNSSSNYGSLRGRALLSRQNNPKEPIVDHDFRYCTISSRRSESAPPNENLFRASFKNLRKLPAKSTAYGCNSATETDCYDFRQLTISPVQSMSVPPDKVTSIEALRNLTVSPVRSVSVIPNQSPKEQEYYSKFGESSNRPASVPADYTFLGKKQNYPRAQGTEISVMPNINYNNQAQRSIATNKSIANDHCLSHGQFTVYSDFNLCIPSDSQTIESTAEIFPPYRTTPDLPGVPTNNNRSPLFSCKHPYLPERSLSVPFNSSHSTDTETDTTSVTSLSSLPDSIISEARSAEDKAAKHLEALDNCLNSETNNLKLETESLKSQSTSNEVDSSHQLTEVVTTKSQTTNEEDIPQNPTKLNTLKKMSLHIHAGITIDPISSENEENTIKNQETINEEQRPAVGTSFGKIHKDVSKTEVIQQKYNGNEFHSKSFQENHENLDRANIKIFQDSKKPDCDDSSNTYDNNIVSKTLNCNTNPVRYSQNSLLESDVEEQPRKPQVPKDLPKEKIKSEAFRLSPLTIQQLKNSPLKLGRSQSISIMDKNRLSKLKDKLSPLRIQTLVNSPFKLGRSIDLFDRKKWRSANDLLDEMKTDTPDCNLLRVNYLEGKKTENVEDFQKGKISFVKEVQNETSLADTKTTTNLSCDYLTDDDGGGDKNREVNSSNFGTLDDRDWALDVLDHLSRISDHHISSFSGKSQAVSEKSRQKNIAKDHSQPLMIAEKDTSSEKMFENSSDPIPLINHNKCNDVNELITEDINVNNVDHSQNSLEQSDYETKSSSQDGTDGTSNGRLQPNIDWKCNSEQEKSITSGLCQKENLVYMEPSHLKDPIVFEPLAMERTQCSAESIHTNTKSEQYCPEQRIYNTRDNSSLKLPLAGKYKLSDVYADAKPSYVGDFISEEAIKNWQVSDQSKELEFAENKSNANNFDELNNSLFREKLVRETNYLWGSPFDRFRPNFSMDDLSYGLRKFPLRTQSFQSRFPRTVSRPVDPQMMPTIFENKIMTEQFIYDDDEAISDMYLYQEPQSQPPPYYEYDDQRHTNTKQHPLYIYERSLAYMDSVHPDGYMTIPSKKPGISWNLKKKKIF